MRSGNVVRPQYFDRNAASQYQDFDTGSVAPHAFTTRWTFTVPAGKLAYIELASAGEHRQTAATTAGLAHAVVSASDGVTSVPLAFTTTFNNTVGASDHANSGAPTVMRPGYSATGQTLDQSTGGTMNHRVSATIQSCDI